MPKDQIRFKHYIHDPRRSNRRRVRSPQGNEDEQTSFGDESRSLSNNSSYFVFSMTPEAALDDAVPMRLPSSTMTPLPVGKCLVHGALPHHASESMLLPPTAHWQNEIGTTNGVTNGTSNRFPLQSTPNPGPLSQMSTLPPLYSTNNSTTGFDIAGSNNDFSYLAHSDYAENQSPDAYGNPFTPQDTPPTGPTYPPNSEPPFSSPSSLTQEAASEPVSPSQTSSNHETPIDFSLLLWNLSQERHEAVHDLRNGSGSTSRQRNRDLASSP